MIDDAPFTVLGYESTCLWMILFRYFPSRQLHLISKIGQLFYLSNKILRILYSQILAPYTHNELSDVLNVIKHFLSYV